MKLRSLALSLALAAPAAADTIHVPAQAPTVETALLLAGAGDEIVLAPGDHAGDFEIENAVDLVIRGQPGARVLVDDTPIELSSLVGVTVRGIEFVGSSDLVLIHSSKGVTIEDCRFTGGGPGDFAFLAEENDGVVVRRCRLDVTGGIGLLIAGDGALVEDCTAIGGDVGIRVHGTRTLVRRCVAKGQTLAGIAVSDAGNVLEDSTVRGNLSIDGENHLVRDVRVKGGRVIVIGSRHRFLGNRVRDVPSPTGATTALLLEDAIDCVVAGNRIVAPPGIGIRVDGGSRDNLLLENVVKKAVGAAYAPAGVGNVLIRNRAKKCAFPVLGPATSNVYLANSFAAP